MYLIDTNVVSELRKKSKMNPGVKAFFKQAEREKHALYISVVTVGELRRGVELIRYRGDLEQAALLEKWLEALLNDFTQNILSFHQEEAIFWGRLRSPHHENALDKQIAATALVYGLTLVTRNGDDFVSTGVNIVNPFSSD